MANKKTTIVSNGKPVSVEVADNATVMVGEFVLELPADETISVDASEVTLVTAEPLSFALINSTVSTKLGLTTVEMPARGKAKVARPKTQSRRSEPQ